MLIPQDYHMHTRFSCDSRATMAEMCQAAIDRGIPEIGFTELFDHSARDECRDSLQLEPWAADLERGRRQFASRLTGRAGVELGEPHLFAPKTARCWPVTPSITPWARCIGLAPR